MSVILNNERIEPDDNILSLALYYYSDTSIIEA